MLSIIIISIICFSPQDETGQSLPNVEETAGADTDDEEAEGKDEVVHGERLSLVFLLGREEHLPGKVKLINMLGIQPMTDS